MRTCSEIILFRVLLLCLLCVPANAALYDLARITNNGEDLTFEAGDFTMDVASQNGGVLITFSNNYPMDSVVTLICFQENDLIEFNDIAAPPISSEGLSFSVNTNNAMLPAGNQYGFTPHSTFAVDADPAGPKNGLCPGESLGLLFDLVNGTTYDNLITAFDQMALRAGIHVQAFPDDYSESFISTIPEPATLALLGIGTLLIRNKRRGTAQ